MPLSAYMMAMSGLLYVANATVYATEGKWWMAGTMLFYAASVGTLFMAGKA